MNSSTSSSSNHRRHLAGLSCFATLLTLLLTVASSHFLPLFDSSPHVVLPPPSTFSFRHTLASALLRWDAFHFGHIARDGYVYEHEWAFFPGAPYVMKFAAAVLDSLSSQGTGDSSAHEARQWENIMLGGLTASLLSVPSTLVLYELTLAHFGSQNIAFLASLLSLLPSSPATLRIAGYTEPFFTFLSYSGMLLCARRRWMLATCCFAAATTFRSNGIFLCGFIAWGLVIDPLISYRKFHLGRALYAVMLCSCAVSFFVYHQYRAYELFCSGQATPAPWCASFPPSIYGYVQAKYWNVGFLRYWTVQQLPNFLLGTPPLALLIAFTLRYTHLAFLPRLFAFFSSTAPERRSAGGTREAGRSPFLTPAIAPHVIHGLVLCLLLLFASHTQIVLRQAASMPLTYWAAAWFLVERPRMGRWWVGWSVVWGAVSCVLWAAFLPPA
ncbi:glycosyltransferase family 76 protein [Trametes coccinea BRFM310]|uniref:GPI mannosyltransferase 2 n=1 Tax=Trametes coccinea (strain BRFM310) TaxID=1353009 RepID=A0A1Y2IH15_TRAC3|nr:glycosyltransferase family 76 protein [Trametes coccinea BRFM310]